MGYSNLFKNSCMFFGSVNRQVLIRAPHCTLPTTKIGLELTQILTNLGVFESYQIIHKDKKTQRTKAWPSELLPKNSSDLRDCPGTFIKINFATELFKLKHLSGVPFGVVPAHYYGRFPNKATNLSTVRHKKVLAVNEIASYRRHLAPGILFIGTDRGLLIDAEAELMKVGGIVLGHVELPISIVAQVQGAVRAKHLQEAGQKLPHVPLSQWSLTEHLRSTLQERIRATSVDNPEVKEQVEELKKEVARQQAQNAALAARHQKNLDDFKDELHAWINRDVIARLVTQLKAPGLNRRGGQGSKDYPGSDKY